MCSVLCARLEADEGGLVITFFCLSGHARETRPSCTQNLRSVRYYQPVSILPVKIVDLRRSMFLEDPLLHPKDCMDSYIFKISFLGMDSILYTYSKLICTDRIPCAVNRTQSFYTSCYRPLSPYKFENSRRADIRFQSSFSVFLRAISLLSTTTYW